MELVSIEKLHEKIAYLKESIKWHQSQRQSLLAALAKKEALIHRQKLAITHANLRALEANKRAYQSVTQRFIRHTTQKIRNLQRELRDYKQANAEAAIMISELEVTRTVQMPTIDQADLPKEVHL